MRERVYCESNRRLDPKGPPENNPPNIETKQTQPPRPLEAKTSSNAIHVLEKLAVPSRLSV
jgi:hypothetical protein